MNRALDSLEDYPIESLQRTSARTIKLLKSLNITTLLDLLDHVPLRYEDYRTHLFIKELSSAPNEKKYTFSAKVKKFSMMTTMKRMTLQKVVFTDGDEITLTWFNQPYLRQVFKPEVSFSLSGMLRSDGQFMPEEYEESAPLNDLVHTGKIIPIYSQTRGLSSKTIRSKIFNVLRSYEDKINEILPEEIVQNNLLNDRKEAYLKIHFPHSHEDITFARRRLAFDELFSVQLASHFIREQWHTKIVRTSFNIKGHVKDLDQLIANQPFSLTKSQQRSLKEIYKDLEKPYPMNRILQGDVGSGKTIIAAGALYASYLNGNTSLLMAPTEILAKQHYKSLQNIFCKLDPKEQPKIILITSNTKSKEKAKNGQEIIVGTHALISKKNIYSNVGLVVIDEQHKFGVVQRAQLKEKGINPHLLAMTATPIPRTAALTLYGELDLSTLDEMPAGRIPIKTHVVPSQKRQDAYVWIGDKIKNEHIQAFIVCPLIEDSSAESLKNVKAASTEFERLTKDVFPNISLKLLHGRMKEKEKDEVMSGFAEGAFDILVTTPVVEVGIDIPKAAVIIIEAPERFGMAQLHQLRGRVGRSDIPSYCLLFPEKSSDRLNFFAQTQNGFKLAEFDLTHRGSGTVYGTAQHGYSELKIASLTDTELIHASQQAVKIFAEKFTIEKFPLLAKRLHRYKIDFIARD